MNTLSNDLPSSSARPARSRAQTVGEALVELLEGHGVSTVFGIPGVHTLELYRGLAASPIRHVTPRHEQGAGFMADGYARVHGVGPGVCFVISGGGVTNIATPVAQAYHDSQPLLVISAEPDRRDRGHGSLHELADQTAVTRSICAFSKTVTDAEELPILLRDAYTSFATARPRPVHISIPTDVLASPAPTLEPLPLGDLHSPQPSPADIAAAAELLAGASRPFLVLGGGGVDAGDSAVGLAELLGAPIITTGNAKAAVPESHPLSLGCALPTEAVLAALREADVVVAVGTELSSVEVLVLDRAIELTGKVIRIDIDPAQLRDERFDTVGLLSDARAALTALRGALLREHSARVRDHHRADELRDAIRWWPQAVEHRPWLEAITTAAGPETVFSLDSTQLAYSALNCLVRPAAAPRSWLVPNGYGTLGPALPMAIGAAVARPDRPAVAIAGDGGAMFTIAELATAAQLELPVVLIVWDSHSYQEIADSMIRASMPQIASDLNTVDFVALGQSLGCDALRVGSPDELHGALLAAIRAARPTVLHIPPARSVPS